MQIPRWLIATCASACLAISAGSWAVLQTSAPELLARHAQQVRAQANHQIARTSSLPVRAAVPPLQPITQPAAQIAAEVVSIPSLDVTLWGTLLEDDSTQATAILEEGKSHILQSYRRGETIQGWTLTEIGRGEVTLATGEHVRRIQLVAGTSGPIPSTAVDAVEPSRGAQPFIAARVVLPPHPWLAADQVKELKDAITSVSDTERLVDRSKALSALKNQNPFRVVREASLQPAFADGLLVGVTLQSVPADGVLQQSGFQTGDIVHAVDGQPVVDPALVFKLPAKLHQANLVTVEVERSGKPVTLDFQLHD